MPSVVELLARDFGATRIVLFGSVARGDAGPESDVDLLVDGLDPARVFEANAAIERAMIDVPIDLAPGASVRPEVRARAEQEGEVLLG